MKFFLILSFLSLCLIAGKKDKSNPLKYDRERNLPSRPLKPSRPSKPSKPPKKDIKSKLDF